MEKKMHRWSYDNRFTKTNFNDFCKITQKLFSEYQKIYHKGKLINEVTTYSSIAHYATTIGDWNEYYKEENDKLILKIAEKITKEDYDEAKYIEVHCVPSILSEGNKSAFMCMKFKGTTPKSVSIYVQGKYSKTFMVRSKNIFGITYKIGGGFFGNCTTSLR